MGSPRKISEWEESLCIRHVLVQNVAENEKSAFPRSKVLCMYMVLVLRNPRHRRPSKLYAPGRGRRH